MTNNSGIAQASASDAASDSGALPEPAHNSHDVRVLRALRTLLIQDAPKPEQALEPAPALQAIGEHDRITEPELEAPIDPGTSGKDELDALFDEWNPTLDSAEPAAPVLAPEHTLVLPLPLPVPAPSCDGKGHTQVLFVPAPVSTVVLEMPGAPDGVTTRIAPIENWVRARTDARDSEANDEALGPSLVAPPFARSVRNRWSALSGPHKLALLLSPVALLATVSVLMPQAPAPVASAARAAPAARSPVSELKPARPAETAAPSPAPAAPASSAPGGKTFDRLAADAIVEGNDAAALAAYRELARQQPNNPAYAAAARILEARLRAASPPN